MQQQYEITIPLPAERTVFAFGRQIVQLPGKFTAGYYPGEETAPFKLTLASAAGTEWREFAFTTAQARQIIALWAAWIRKRGMVPHNITDE